MLAQTFTSTLRRKLYWFAWVRVMVVTILLGCGILVELRSFGTWPLWPFFSVVGLGYIFSIFVLVFLRQVRRHRWFVDLQFAVDALLISVIVLLTGGISSYFSTFFALPIIGASALQLRRGGMLVGGLSALLYVGVVAAQYLGGLESFEARWPAMSLIPQPPPVLALYMVGIDVFGFIAIALFSGYLAERLQTADESLKQASSELADLQAFNLHVIESLASGLVTADQGGRVLTFNGAAEHITARPASEVVGMRVVDVLHLSAELEASLLDKDKAGRCVELQFTRPGGRVIDLGLSAAPLITPRGWEGFLFLFHDVTETRRIQRKGAAQERLAAVGEMAAAIAHEIRNPLASMSGAIQLLREQLPLNVQQEQLMDIVLRESSRLNGTITSFLAYARPQQLPGRRFDLRPVVQDTALLLGHSAESDQHHEIRVKTPSGPVWLDADESQIRQIIWNLARNGLKAMPSGGELVLGVEVCEAEVMLSVRDEGVGMSPEELELMFQPFHGTFTGGTGLGLSIVYGIVSKYGGDIQANSEPGAGTTVIVRLPVPTAMMVPSRELVSVV